MGVATFFSASGLVVWGGGAGGGRAVMRRKGPCPEPLLTVHS